MALSACTHSGFIGCAAHDQGTELSKLEAFFSGGFARAIAAAATVPFTIVKTRMEYQGPQAFAYKVFQWNAIILPCIGW